MSGPILSPLDVPGPLEGYLPSGPGGGLVNPGALMAPPIVPNLTQLGPEKMRSVLQQAMQGEPSDEDEAAEGETAPVLSPPEIIAQVGKLAYDATQYDGLPQVLITLIRTILRSTTLVAPMGGGLPPPLSTSLPPRSLSLPGALSE